jgi:hypothetical protein
VAFHVFIEKAVDATAAGRARLASSIAAKYRLPEAQVAQHLQAGRFRVKSNVDEATARRFAGELQALGAIVSIEDAQTGAKLAAPTASAPQKFESGLAAAFSAQTPASLGALENLASVSLASLDGDADESFSGPVGLTAAAPPPSLPTNAFHAPDEEAEVPLDIVGTPRPTPRPAPAPPPPTAVIVAPPPPRPTPAPTPRPAVRAAAYPVEGGPLAPYFVDKPKQRLLAGAALALLIGFVPAHLYAAGAEDDKYGKIRNDLMTIQQAATTPTLWEALDAPDGPRPTAAKAMARARGRIRTNTAVLWALISGAAAFVWFRKLT